MNFGIYRTKRTVHNKKVVRIVEASVRRSSTVHLTSLTSELV